MASQRFERQTTGKIEPATGGEMEALIRSFDWSRTAIGPPEGWSPALRTTVRILLANALPMLLWWGPDYISIYNDAYRPILGTKHPWALGKPVRECWSEIWSVLKPLIDTPFQGGPATWIEDIELFINRSGFTEETHFTVAYSPVPDEAATGGIGGVLATVHEITAKVLGERRVLLLRELGARVAEAKTAENACLTSSEILGAHRKDIPFALLYLTDPGGKDARLAASCGLDQSSADIAPGTIDLDGSTAAISGWPLALVRSNEQLETVADLSSRFDTVPPGFWSDPPHTAAVLPIRSNIAHELSGFFVAGLNPYLVFDEDYKTFLELAATQIATAIANARAHEEERRRAEALAEIDRAKTVFFSNVSHEFRTPLTLMLGPLEDALAQADNAGPEIRERLEIAHRNSLRLLKLVNSLLDFSRIEAGRVQATYEPTDLAAFTAELASTFRSAIERAGLKLIVNCPPLSEPAYVDREMWEKIVLNLLSNAFKFTLEGEIEISLRRIGNTVEFAVRDTGTGIPAEELPRLFDRFHRVKSARGRTFEGSGIGLALVQELVKLHGGAIRVESEVDRGSRFTVSIPLNTAHLSSGRTGPSRTSQSGARQAEAFVEEALRWLPEATRQTKLPSSLSQEVLVAEDTIPHDLSIAALHRPSILLADDNADMREYVQRLLGRFYDVTAVSDGSAALESAWRQTPDLVLTDVMMPRLDGFALLRELRADKRTQGVPVILLSARAGEESRVEGFDAGADDYLVKPFSAKELLARVESCLKLQKLRRQAQAESQRQRRLYEAILTNTPDLAYVFDLNHRFIYANEGLLKMWGRTWDEAIGKNCLELGYEPWHAAMHDREIEQVIATKQPIRGVVPFTGTFGRRLYDYIFVPVFGADGQVEAVAGTTRDVTDIKQAQEALRQSEERFRAIVEQSTAGISQTDLEGRFLLVNDRYCDITGYSRDELLARRPHDITCAEDLPETEKAFRRLVNDGTLYVVEKRYNRKDGGTVWVRNAVSAILDAEGQPQCTVAVTIDITERKRWEEDLKRANADLEQFAYSASHDLQEPLRSLSIFSQLLTKQYGHKLEGQGLEYLNYLHGAAQRMEMLVRDLLAYTQLMKVEAATEISDSDKVLKTALASLDGAAAESGAKISFDLLPSVRIHSTHLQQLFQNIIGNAIKYRSPKQAPVIHVSAERQEGVRVFSVTDNGIGIDPKYKERIFGVFKRLHTNQEYSGTGIGLAICQRIVERYHGRIWVESEPGKGSTFRFTLPE